MATAAFPSVIAGVFATATTAAPTARVVRGGDITDTPGDAVLVGITSLDDSPGWASAGSFEQTPQTFGGKRSEVGSVNGLAVSRNGDSDQAAATEAAFALLAALEVAVQATPGLGITGFDYVVAQLESGEVRESQNADGAIAALSFVVNYQARI